MTSFPMNQELRLEDLRFNPPQIPHDILRKALKDNYSLEGNLSALEGERDQNVLVEASDGQRFVFKIAGALEDPRVIDMQAHALRHLECAAPKLPIPRLRRSQSGEIITTVQAPDGARHLARLVSWLDGAAFDSAAAPTEQALQEIGTFLGKVTGALSSFSHSAADHFMPWNIANGLVISDGLWATAGGDVRQIAAPLRARFRDSTLETLQTMRTQIIHNDGHAGNILRRNKADETITGLIDFGDMVQAPLICDLAVAAAGFQFGGRPPMDVAICMLQGYHATMPLTDQEIRLLPTLIAMRKTLSLLMYDFRIKHMEAPPAFLLEERPGMLSILAQLADTDLDQAGEALLRQLA